MILFGLTGGIGSGKSSVSAMLREFGAVVVDGDQVARELQTPGSEAVAAIAAAFPGVVSDEGVLDRGALAQIVFGDPQRLGDLNGIMLPRIHAEIERRIDALRGTDQIVILDLPLLTENPRNDLAGVIVVDLAHDIAVERLVDQRGMSEADARARIARQAPREERRKIADVVIDNSGDLEDLRRRVCEVWDWLVERHETGTRT
jgi:dephospho-CoA kinase